MKENEINKEIVSEPAGQMTNRHRKLITGERLAVLGVALTAVFAGLVMLMVPEKFGWALIALPFIVIVCVLIIRNPFIGVFAFLTYNTLRPYDFMPFLIPLRLTLILEVLALVAWIVSLVIKNNYIKWSLVHTLFALFMVPVALGMVTAVNNFHPYVILQTLLVYYVIFVVATNVIDTTKRIKLIIWMLLFVHAYFAINGIYTFVTGAYTDVTGNTSGAVGSGPMGDENDFALAINMMIPFAFFGFQYLKGKSKIICGGLMILFVLAVVSSFSRGGMVGLVAVIVFGIVSSQKKAIAASTAILLLLVMVMFAPTRYWAEAESITDTKEATADARLEFWMAAVEMFIDNPIIGVGAQNGGVHMPNYFRGASGGNRLWGVTFHGTWPQLLAELGLMGVIPYLLMLVLSLRALWRIRRESKDDEDPTGRFIANGLIGSLIAYQTCATFLSTAYYPQTYYTYALVWAFVFCYKPENKAAKLIISKRTNTQGPVEAELDLRG